MACNQQRHPAPSTRLLHPHDAGYPSRLQRGGRPALAHDRAYQSMHRCVSVHHPQQVSAAVLWLHCRGPSVYDT
eukprot:COSAG01_NODE_17672_length_1132_cov_1.885770_1_plen_73_part_10